MSSFFSSQKLHYLSTASTLVWTLPFQASQPKGDTFSMSAIPGGDSRRKYIISDLNKKYIQWNDNGGIQVSGTDSTTPWDKVSNPNHLTFFYTSDTKLDPNGFRLQTLNVNGKYLKEVVGSGDYIEALAQEDTFGLFVLK